MVEDVLPDVAYAPLVFTIPKILRRAFLFDSRLYSDLCRAAYRVVREAFEARLPHLDRPVPAFLASSQSFGSLLNFHPHAHALVSCGVFDRGGAFHPAAGVDSDGVRDGFDFTALELPFRDAVLAVLEKRGAIDEERAALVRSWPHSGFGVHADRVIQPGSRRELESILQYMERAPVSLKRLTLRPDGMVHYQGRYHPGLGRDHQLVTGVEFLALLVPHIQHRYQSKIRTYGALSTTIRKRFGWIGRAPAPAAAGESSARTIMHDADSEDTDTGFTRARKRGWAHLIRKVWLEDPEQCEKCGGTMKIVSALSGPVQDDAIRAILESTGQWDPPWNRRAPPPALVVHGAETGQPSRPSVEPEYDIDYEVDPDAPWPDD
jgi:hypothetical protein